MLPTRHPLILAALAVLLLAASSGCSVLTDFDECSSDDECSAGTCNKGICEVVACATTDECGSGELCVRSSCLTLDPEMCTIEEGLASTNNEVLHLGMLFPYTGRNAEKADATANAAKTALRQINLAHNGIRGVELGAIECDTQQNSERAVEVARYMVDTLGLPSIMGSISSDETLDVSEVTIPAGTVLLSPASTSPALTSLEDDDLVWRTIASDAVQGPALAQMVVEGAYENVLVLSVESAYGQGLFNAFIGAGTVPNDSIEALTYQVDDNGDLVGNSVVEEATQLLVTDGYQPDVIVIMGSLESQQLIFALDDTFFGELPDAEKPDWILSEAGRDSGLLDERFSGVWNRLQGTIIQSPESAVYDDFELRFRTDYMLDAVDHPFADKAYDAAWLLALAHGAAQDPLASTGDDVADALAKTSSGPEFSPGDDLVTALDAVAGDGVDYQGASGDVDFDPDTGDVQSTVSKWVISVDVDTSAAMFTNEGPIGP